MANDCHDSDTGQFCSGNGAGKAGGKTSARGGKLRFLSRGTQFGRGARIARAKATVKQQRHVVARYRRDIAAIGEPGSLQRARASFNTGMSQRRLGSDYRESKRQLSVQRASLGKAKRTWAIRSSKAARGTGKMRNAIRIASGGRSAKQYSSSRRAARFMSARSRRSVVNRKGR